MFFILVLDVRDLSLVSFGDLLLFEAVGVRLNEVVADQLRLRRCRLVPHARSAAGESEHPFSGRCDARQLAVISFVILANQVFGFVRVLRRTGLRARFEEYGAPLRAPGSYDLATWPGRGRLVHPLLVLDGLLVPRFFFVKAFLRAIFVVFVYFFPDLVVVRALSEAVLAAEASGGSVAVLPSLVYTVEAPAIFLFAFHEFKII